MLRALHSFSMFGVAIAVEGPELIPVISGPLGAGGPWSEN